MEPLAPLDYERYTIIHNPLLVSHANPGAATQTRLTEPVGPSATTHRRQGTLAQEMKDPAGADIGKSRGAVSATGQFDPVRSQLSVELSSISGIPPDILFGPKESIGITSHVAAERYEISDGISFAKLNITG